jgi:cell division protein FtsI (penicillin-binding protein 3)
MEKQESPIKKGITRRSWIVYWLFVLFGVVIIGRILYIQYGPEGDTLRERAVDSRTFQYTELKAERGDILAHDGRPLALSAPYYLLTIDARATGLTDSVFNAHVDSLAWYLAGYFKDKSREQYKNLLVSGRNRALQPGANRMFRIAPRRVAYHELTTLQRFPLLRERNRNVSGLVLERDTLRVYPYGSIARRTIGRQSRNSVQGVGIEGAFDRQLRGVDGVTK